jgi:hypothetical protein
LSGCATKVLFSMLEQLAWQGKRNSSWLWLLAWEGETAFPFH